ncbi:hypothetical protein ES702_07676 [subsurface metagenome]
MAKKQRKKSPHQPIEEKLNKSESEHTTKEIKPSSQDKEQKPPFKELLSKEEKRDPSSTESSPLGSEEEILVDENIVEISGDFIAIFFDIWHERNKDVPPLSEKEKANISVPLAKIVAKYDLKKYMKEEFVLFFYLGGAIYSRTKIKKVKKHDKDADRKAGEGKDISPDGVDRI